MTDADLVILGASLEPMTGAPAPGDALALAEGRIVAIGRRDEVARLAGARTRVLHLDGATVLPGFQDAHVHPISGGLLAARCDLHALSDAAAYLDAVARHAAAHPEAAWITGSGWAMPAFPGGNPGREALDALLPDRPAYLTSRDGHSAWVNSRALALAGVSAATPDPSDGRIQRDADGEPSGTLHEGAMLLVQALVPPPGAAELDAVLPAAQRHLHALGITAWQDAEVQPDELAAYRRAARAGRLTARVVLAQAWQPSRGLEQIPELLAARADAAADGVQAGSVKFYVDGIIENGTAMLTEPYLGSDGRPSANRGLPMVDPDLLLAAVAELDRHGFQCHFHAIGDGAVRLALDAVEGARRANGPTDGRHHIAHIELIHPTDIPRFAAVGAVANMQPIWASYDDQMRDLRLPALGPERATWQFPFARLLRSGARLAAGSDWPVSSPNPLLEMEVAVTRVDPGTRDDPPFLPEQRLPLDAALAAFTSGSAWVNHLEAETGTLEVGKAADLVVLDRDLHHTGRPIGEARVVLTLAAGVEVFSA